MKDKQTPSRCWERCSSPRRMRVWLPATPPLPPSTPRARGAVGEPGQSGEPCPLLLIPHGRVHAGTPRQWCRTSPVPSLGRQFGAGLRGCPKVGCGDMSPPPVTILTSVGQPRAPGTVLTPQPSSCQGVIGQRQRSCKVWLWIVLLSSHTLNLKYPVVNVAQLEGRGCSVTEQIQCPAHPGSPMGTSLGRANPSASLLCPSSMPDGFSSSCRAGVVTSTTVCFGISSFHSSCGQRQRRSRAFGRSRGDDTAGTRTNPNAARLHEGLGPRCWLTSMGLGSSSPAFAPCRCSGVFAN